MEGVKACALAQLPPGRGPSAAKPFDLHDISRLHEEKRYTAYVERPCSTQKDEDTYAAGAAQAEFARPPAAGGAGGGLAG